MDQGAGANAYEVLVARFAIAPDEKAELVGRLRAAGEAAKPALLQGMKHRSWRVRHGCLRVLDHTVIDDDTRLTVIAALADGHRKVRHAALHVLRCEQCKPEGFCGIEGVDIDGLLLEAAVSDPSLRVRRSAILHFRHIDRLNPRVVERIDTAAATTADPELRRRAESVLRLFRT